MGKKEEGKIKKLLQLDNPEMKKINFESNRFLSEYFSREEIE